MPHPTLSPTQARQLGDTLRKRRKHLGLSQEKVALASGITLQHYSLLENGYSDGRRRSPANPSLGLITSVSRALSMDISFLVQALDEDPEPSAGDDDLTA
ncbi:helix-turn-helix transcriptional regulator [Falsarthrobacter nasiphocae]|uniref:Transcriptional regulator with XRE-family HTH domain n=1 Tax=Falsarthrobacter nasiphocae TaxID=189863 RepID=A0AAE3YEH5_9MICC|nr:helix-turn-helix transcriptional regulator [Falsarthrobacter nasiphocae]MDR6892383.1 transcriptional regulator with XRE-family HTH domain [Falsarthrobacter nasiphocae]